MSGSISKSNRAEPNLTPVLDMVFQLITFFVLVTNLKSNQLDMQMDLPVVGTARTMDTKQLLLLMININNRGQYTVFGHARSLPEMEQYIQAAAVQDRLAARGMDRNFTEEDDLPTIVVIRADRNTPFQKVSQILKICQDNHYRNFAFRAMAPHKT